MLKIITVPNKTLTTPAQPVTRFDNKLRKLIIDMEETLVAQIDPQGVGLAAPQVGVPLQLFIIRPNERSKSEVFINPKILDIATNHELRSPSEALAKLETTNKKKPKKKENKLEGCLSIPRIWGPVQRPQKVYVQYQTIDGTTKTEWFSGLKATIIQHEIDHLDGILFTQRALEQNTPLYEEKGEEFVKIDSSV